MNKQLAQHKQQERGPAQRQRTPKPDALDQDLLEHSSSVGRQEALTRAAMARPGDILHLQRSVGNRAVQRLVQPDTVQTALDEDLRQALARQRRLIAPEDTETIHEMGVGTLLERQKQERQQELEALYGRGLVTGMGRRKQERRQELEALRSRRLVSGKSEAELEPLSGVLSSRLPDERGLRERGYDPMEQTLYGKPKYLASTVEEPRTAEPETPQTTGESSSGTLSALLSLLKQLSEKLGG